MDDRLMFLNKSEEQLTRVTSALKRIRTQVVIDEHKLHQLIATELTNEGIVFQHEFQLGNRNRIDFLTSTGIGIEAKKGKPNEQQVLNQLERYAGFPQVAALILVIERYMDLPEVINGKPVRSIGLRKLWGIASK